MSVGTACAPVRLETGLLELLSRPSPDREAHWQQLINHPQYRHELRRTTGYFIQRYGLPRDWQGDIEQDAVLLLHRSMHRRSNLGFDPDKGRDRVLPWLRAVIRSHCLQAIRRLRSQHRPYQALDETSLAGAAGAGSSWQIILWSAIESLPPKSRRLIEAYLEGGSIRATAAELGVTWSTARRALNRDLRLLRRALYARHGDALAG